MTISRDAGAGTNDSGNGSTPSTGLGTVTLTLTITLSADRLKTFMDEVIAAAKVVDQDPNPPSPIGGSGPVNPPGTDPPIGVDILIASVPAGN